MKILMNLISRGYAVTVTALALWAWYIDIMFINSKAEHLLSDVCLAYATLPASLTLDLMQKYWVTAPLVQLTWVTMCAVVQSSILFFLTHVLSRRNNDA